MRRSARSQAGLERVENVRGAGRRPRAEPRVYSERTPLKRAPDVFPSASAHAAVAVPYFLQTLLASWLMLKAALAGVAAAAVHADVPATLAVDVSTPGPIIPASFFDMMTEEINHAYDGGPPHSLTVLRLKASLPSTRLMRPRDSGSFARKEIRR